MCSFCVSVLIFVEMDYPPVWIHPSTGVVAAPTFSGKTFWIRSLLESGSISPSPDVVVWFYGTFQSLYEEMLQTCPYKLIFYQGLPDGDIGDYLDKQEGARKFVVLDDLMQSCIKDSRITKLFTQGSHHRNLSVLFVTQNLYTQGKESRNIALNAHYLVLFKNPRDKQQISMLSRQMYPKKSQIVMEAYEDATKRAFGYLMICLRADVDERFRLATNVLPKEHPRVYYVPKYLN